jgi:hypothetical protein
MRDFEIDINARNINVLQLISRHVRLRKIRDETILFLCFSSVSIRNDTTSFRFLQMCPLLRNASPFALNYFALEWRLR